jgi:hypothetical protein
LGAAVRAQTGRDAALLIEKIHHPRQYCAHRRAGAGRGMVCCAFPPIGYMKPGQPGASPMPGLAKGGSRATTMAMTE